MKKQTSLNFKTPDKKIQWTTNPSETSIYFQSKRQINRGLETSEYSQVKITNNRNLIHNEEANFRIKMKLQNIISQFTNQLKPDFKINEVEIEQLLRCLVKVIRQKFNGFQKKIRATEQNIKQLEIDKINLQTEIETNQIQVMKLVAKNQKYNRIMAQDRERWQKKRDENDQEMQILINKNNEISMLLKDRTTSNCDLQGKIRQFKKEIEAFKNQLFEKEKNNMKLKSEQKQQKLLLEQQIENLKQSLLRTCQQKTRISDEKKKFAESWQTEKDKRWQQSRRYDRLESENSNLVSRIQQLTNDNLILHQSTEAHKQMYQNLQQKIQTNLAENCVKLKITQNRVEGQCVILKQTKKKLQKLIKQLYQNKQMHKQSLNSLQEHHNNQIKYLNEQLQIANKLVTIKYSGQIKQDEIFQVQSN